MKDFDKNFLFECIKNDLINNNFDTSTNINVIGNIYLDIPNKKVSGEEKIEFSKKDLNSSICDFVNNKKFSILVRYGVLGYKCYIKSDNEFYLYISEYNQENLMLEDITIQEIFADEFDFFFHDNLLKSKENISSFSDFKSVISSLFAISTLPKGKNKTYSFFVSGLNITKENMMKLKDTNDQVPAVDRITFADCVGDKDFVKTFFEKSTIIDFK